MAKYEHQINYKISTTYDNKGMQQLMSSLTAVQQRLATMSNEMYGVFGANTPKYQANLTSLQKIISNSVDEFGRLNANQFSKEIQKANYSMKDFGTIIKNTGAEGQVLVNNLAGNLNLINTRMRRTTQMADKIMNTLGNTVRWGLIATAFQSIMSAIQGAASYIKRLDESLTQITMVSGESRDNMKDFAKYANQAARELGSATTDYTNAVKVFIQEGFNLQESIKQATQATILGNVSEQDTATTADQITAYRNAFHLSIEDMDKSLDKLANIANKTAANVNELMVAAQKSASTAASVGASEDSFLASIATIQSVTREAAENIGNGLKSIYTRLADVKMGKTTEDGVGYGQYSAALKSAGVDILDNAGNVKTMDQILTELQKVWQTLDTSKKLAVGEKVAGRFQYNRFAALMNNAEYYEKAFAATQNANGAMSRMQEDYMQGLEAIGQRIATNFESVYTSIYNSGTVENLAKSFMKLTDVMANTVHILDDGAPFFDGFKTILAALVAFVTKIGSTTIAENLTNITTNMRQRRINRQSIDVQNSYAWQQLRTEGLVDSAEANPMTQRLIQTQRSINQYSPYLSANQLEEQRRLQLQLIKLTNEYTLAQEQAKKAVDAITKTDALFTTGLVDQNVVTEKSINEIKVREAEIQKLEQELQNLNREEALNTINKINSLKAQNNQILNGNTIENLETNAARTVELSRAFQTLTLSENGEILGKKEIKNNLIKYLENTNLNSITNQLGNINNLTAQYGANSEKAVNLDVTSRQKLRSEIEKLIHIEGVEEKVKIEYKQLLQELEKEQSDYGNILTKINNLTNKQVNAYINIDKILLELAPDIQKLNARASELGITLEQLFQRMNGQTEAMALQKRFAQISRGVSTAASSFMSFSMVLSSMSNIVKTLGDETATTQEKWESFFNAIPMLLMSIAPFIGQIGTGLSNLINARALEEANIIMGEIGRHAELTTKQEALLALAREKAAQETMKLLLAEQMHNMQLSEEESITAGNILFTALRTEGIEKLTTEEGKNFLVEQLKIAGITEDTAVTLADTFATGLNSAAIRENTKEILKNMLMRKISLGPILAVVAALAALAGIIYLVYRAQTKEERELKQAQEKLDELSKATEESTQALSDFNSALDEIESRKDAFENLIKGSKEYKEAVNAASKATLDLYDQYKDLFGDFTGTIFTRGEHGELIFTDEAMSHIESKLKGKANEDIIAEAKGSQEVATKQLALDARNAVDAISPKLDRTTQDMVEQLYIDIAEAMAKGEFNPDDFVGKSFGEIGAMLSKAGLLTTDLINNPALADIYAGLSSADFANKIEDLIASWQTIFANSQITAAQLDTSEYTEGMTDQEAEVFTTMYARRASRVLSTEEAKSSIREETEYRTVPTVNGADVVQETLYVTSDGTKFYREEDAIAYEQANYKPPTEKEVKEDFDKYKDIYDLDALSNLEDIDIFEYLSRKEEYDKILEDATILSSSFDLSALKKAAAGALQIANLGGTDYSAVADALVTAAGGEEQFFGINAHEAALMFLEAGASPSQVVQLLGLLRGNPDLTPEALMGALDLSTENPREISNADIKKLAEQQAFNGNLAADYKVFGLDNEEVKQYKDTLMDFAPGPEGNIDDSLRIDAKTAESAAVEMMRLQKGFDAAGEGLDEWTEKLAYGNEQLPEFATAIAKAGDAIYDMAGLTKSETKNLAIYKEAVQKFVNDGTLQRALDGIPEALAEIDATMTMIELGFDPNSPENTALYETIQSWMAKSFELEIGADVTLNTDFISTYNTALESLRGNTEVTADNIESMLEQMTNTDLEIATVPVSSSIEQDGNWVDPTTGKSVPIEGSQIINGNYVYLRSAKNKPNLKSVTLPQQKSGGGGSKKPKEYEYDRYERVNNQLDLNKSRQDYLTRNQERVSGKELINNLLQQNELIQEQIDLEKEKNKIREGEIDEVRQALSNYGVQFDEDGIITNWKQIIDKMNREAAIHVNDENYIEYLDKIQKYYERYNALDDEHIGALKEISDLENQIQDKLIESFKAAADIATTYKELRDNLRQVEDSWAHLVGEDTSLYKMRKAFEDINYLIHDNTNLSKEMGKAFANAADEFAKQGNGPGQMLAQAFSDELMNSDSPLKLAATWQKMIQDGFKELQTDGSWSFFGTTFTNDDFQSIQELFSWINDYLNEMLSTLNDAIDQEFELFQDEVDRMTEAFDRQSDALDHINDNIDYYGEVMEAIYGDNAIDQLIALDKQKIENINTSLNLYNQQMAQDQRIIQELEAARGNYEEGSEQWLQIMDQIHDKQDEIVDLQDKYNDALKEQLELLKDIADKQVRSDTRNFLSNIIPDYEYNFKNWELLNENEEDWLDLGNRAYELQKLNNRYTEALDNAASPAAQKKINDLMQDELKMLREKDKLSQYDIDYANAKLDLLEKQLALEDAQMNKQTMRLRRDSQGNYSYVYSANEDEIKKAQEDALNAWNELYNLARDRSTEIKEEAISAAQEFEDKMAEIANNLNLSTEQRAALTEVALENFKDKMQYITDQSRKNMGDLTEAIEHDSEKIGLTLENAGAFNYIQSLGEITTAYLPAVQQWVDTLGAYADNPEELTNDLFNKVTETIYGLDAALQESQIKINDAIGGPEGIQTNIDNARIATEQLADEWNDEKWNNMGFAENLQKILDLIKQIKEEAPSLAENLQLGTDYLTDETSANKKYQTDSLVNNQKINLAKEYSAAAQNYEPGSEQWNDLMLKMQQLLAEIDTYDTGGYTGTWTTGIPGTDNGRFAILHQKELVLNEEQTKDILAAAQLVKSMTTALQNSVFSNIASGLGSVFAKSDFSQPIEQSVVINADFPAAESAAEIRMALEDLSNQASMYAFRTR